MLILGAKNSALQYIAEEFGEPFFYAQDIENISDYLINAFNCNKMNNSIVSQKENHIDRYAYSELVKQFVGLFV